MSKLGTKIGIAFTLIVANSAVGLTAMSPIEGYKCMSVNWPEEKKWDRAAAPKVYRGPSEESAQVGVQGEPAIVKWPMNELNGFVEIIRPGRPGGQRAWIKASDLTGLRANCVPSHMSDGSVGFKFGK
jgi:hypothetical protein